jgi:hypothetical protein
MPVPPSRAAPARPDPAAPGELQGCYADLDGVSSALALLRREERT